MHICTEIIDSYLLFYPPLHFLTSNQKMMHLLCNQFWKVMVGTFNIVCKSAVSSNFIQIILLEKPSKDILSESTSSSFPTSSRIVSTSPAELSCL